MRRRTAIHRTAVACSCAALTWLSGAGLAQAQMVQYGTAMSMYKDMQDKEIKVTDTVTPSVAARSRVAKALADRSMVDARAMVGEDGTLRLLLRIAHGVFGRRAGRQQRRRCQGCTQPGAARPIVFHCCIHKTLFNGQTGRHRRKAHSA